MNVVFSWKRRERKKNNKLSPSLPYTATNNSNNHLFWSESWNGDNLINKFHIFIWNEWQNKWPRTLFNKWQWGPVRWQSSMQSDAKWLADEWHGFFLQTKCLLIKWKLCFRLFFDLSDSHFNNNLLVWVLMGLAFFNWVNRLLANKPAVIFFFRLLHEVRRRKKNKLPKWIYILFYDSRFNIRIGQAWKIVVFMDFMWMWIRVI